MHAGFAALRNRCPMNISERPRSSLAVSPTSRPMSTASSGIWTDCRERFGAGGDFLFGRFTNADAMYAPVVNRIHVYAMPVPPEAQAMSMRVMATPMWQEWEARRPRETHAIAEITRSPEHRG